MKNIIIVGAGGFGRELYSWLIHHPDFNKEWTTKGFIDDSKFGKDLSSDPLHNYPVPLLNSIDNYQVMEDDLFILGVGEPKVKEILVQKLDLKKAKYFSYIHPSAVIGQNIRMGKGTIICPNVTITCDIDLGDFVMINVNSVIGHDSTICDFTTLSGHCGVAGFCKLGKGVFFGTHATIVPKTIVEDYAIVGAGTVGIRKVKAKTTIFGVPGKKIN